MRCTHEGSGRRRYVIRGPSRDQRLASRKRPDGRRHDTTRRRGSCLRPCGVPSPRPESERARENVARHAHPPTVRTRDKGREKNERKTPHPHVTNVSVVSRTGPDRTPRVRGVSCVPIPSTRTPRTTRAYASSLVTPFRTHTHTHVFSFVRRVCSSPFRFVSFHPHACPRLSPHIVSVRTRVRSFAGARCGVSPVVCLPHTRRRVTVHPRHALLPARRVRACSSSRARVRYRLRYANACAPPPGTTTTFRRPPPREYGTSCVVSFHTRDQRVRTYIPCPFVRSFVGARVRAFARARTSVHATYVYIRTYAHIGASVRPFVRPCIPGRAPACAVRPSSPPSPDPDGFFRRKVLFRDSFRVVASARACVFQHVRVRAARRRVPVRIRTTCARARVVRACARSFV